MSIKPEARQACPDPPGSEVKRVGSSRAKVQTGRVQV
jgi:hypothetical protein